MPRPSVAPVRDIYRPTDGRPAGRTDARREYREPAVNVSAVSAARHAPGGGGQLRIIGAGQAVAEVADRPSVVKLSCAHTPRETVAGQCVRARRRLHSLTTEQFGGRS